MKEEYYSFYRIMDGNISPLLGAAKKNDG